MKHLLELLKIVDGALNADHNKVVAYCELLAERLISEGEVGTASKIKAALAGSSMLKLNAANFKDSKNLPADQESRMPLADRTFFPKDGVKVFLEPETGKVVESFIAYINASDQLISNDVPFSPTLLMHGPPGCGKSEVAKYIAAQLNLPLVTAQLDSLVSSFLGSTSKNIRNLFTFANSTPCVLFLDEFDAIAKVRDDQHEMGELKRVVVSLLQNIDRLDRNTILIAATNHEHLLDQAVWRRFSYKIKMDRPSCSVRQNLFKLYLDRFSTIDFCSELSEISAGLTGSEIKNISEEAKRQAVLSGKSKISEKEMFLSILKNALKTTSESVAPNDEMLKQLRSLNPKVFTYRRLSEIFDVSTGQISNLLSERTIHE